MVAAPQEPLFRLTNIRKRYGAIEALGGVSFDVYPNEVVGLVGDNGAGKSTTVKIISGVLQADEGSMYFDKKPVDLKGPLDAKGLGIETVYQDLALAPHLDIASNLFLGREDLQKGLWGKLGFLNRKKMDQEAHEVLTHMNVRNIKDIHKKVSDLSGGQRQAIAIARATSGGAKLVLLDEPTAALGVQESAQVLDLIKQLKTKGTSIIFICHTMPHVLEVTDKIVVLKGGKVNAILKTKDTNSDEITQYIMGAKTQSS